MKSTDLTHEQIKLYLMKAGWKEFKTNHASIIALREPVSDNPVEVFLPQSKEVSRYHEKLYEVIETLSSLEDKELILVSRAIRCIDSDMHNYRVDYAQESIPIELLSNIVDSAKAAIVESARYEYRKEYNELKRSGRKDIDNTTIKTLALLRDTNFAHTWQGSFGMTIEVPLWLPSYGLLEDIPETLGRRISRRIVNGLKIVDEAVKRQSYKYILDTISDIHDISIFATFPSIQDYLATNKIEFSTNFSPSIKVEQDIKDNSTCTIDRNKLSYIEQAIDEIRLPDEESDISFVGFPETIKSTKDDLLKDAEGAERRVTVNGISAQTGNVKLRMDLMLEDYRKALDAQMEIKNVHVRCKIRRKIRGWEVIEVNSFVLLDD